MQHRRDDALTQLPLRCERSVTPRTGEDAHVGALQANAGLHHGDELLEEAASLVEVRHLLQVVRVYDDVQTTQLRQPELALLHARIAHLRRRDGSTARDTCIHCVWMCLDEWEQFQSVKSTAEIQPTKVPLLQPQHAWQCD